jgi:hypothetical protein
VTSLPRASDDARARLRRDASDRSLLIDFYAARCCTSGLIGDLETRWVESRWLEAASAGEAKPLGAIEGVPILADRRLLALLAGGAELVRAGPVFARSIGVRLDHPEAWLDFLDTPAARRPHRPASLRHGAAGT